MLFAGLLAVGGCQERTEQVLDRLPPPSYDEVSDRPAQEPSRAPAAAPATRPDQSWFPVVRPRPWTSIVIHHSDSAYGSLADINRWHRDIGWDGCGYDFVIGDGSRTPDGLVETSDRWRYQMVGAHTKLSDAEARRLGVGVNYYNEHGIGICLVGQFDHGRPSEKQMAALARLVSFLMETYGIPESRVYGHGHLKATQCPGRNFSMWDLMQRIRALN